MARVSRPGGSSSKRFGSSSSKQLNASGYAKRHEKKAKSQSLKDSANDIYEYKHEKTRRSKITLDLDKDEAAVLGGDDDEDDSNGGRGGTQARLIGEHEENEMIASEDDEDIDSDAAFEESDEDRFAGFSFAKVSASISLG